MQGLRSVYARGYGAGTLYKFRNEDDSRIE